jgi:hypothetical protein
MTRQQAEGPQERSCTLPDQSSAQITCLVFVQGWCTYPPARTFKLGVILRHIQGLRLQSHQCKVGQAPTTSITGDQTRPSPSPTISHSLHFGRGVAPKPTTIRLLMERPYATYSQHLSCLRAPLYMHHELPFSKIQDPEQSRSPADSGPTSTPPPEGKVLPPEIPHHALATDRGSIADRGAPRDLGFEYAADFRTMGERCKYCDCERPRPGTPADGPRPVRIQLKPTASGRRSVSIDLCRAV